MKMKKFVVELSVEELVGLSPSAVGEAVLSKMERLTLELVSVTYSSDEEDVVVARALHGSEFGDPMEWPLCYDVEGCMTRQGVLEALGYVVKGVVTPEGLVLSPKYK